MTSKSWLRRQAQLHPEHPALYWQDCCWTFASLNQFVQQYAAYYAKILPEGCRRVAIFSTNRPEMYLTILSLWELGIEVQLLNTRLTTEEINYQLADAKTAIVVSQVILEGVKADCYLFPSLEEKMVAPAAPIDLGYQEQGVASIMYTSGTTGFPKGVSQTFANHSANSEGARENMALTKEDCWLLSLPLYHISGLSILLRSLRTGLAVFLVSKYDPQQVMQKIIDKRITLASVVSKNLQDILPFVPEEGCPDAFRSFLLGGGPVAESVLITCREKRVPVIQSYGMTETCSQIVALPPEKAWTKIGSSGRPLIGTQLRIKDGPVGEIQVKGPAIVSSYIQQKNQPAAKDGWFSTGDLGYLDEEGYLFVKSRKSELIISGGENIYPAEVEQQLVRVSGVEEAAVVGETDPEWGQRVVAFLKLSQAIDLEELDRQLTASLARYKWPKHLYAVSAFPKTASGKIVKRLLLTKERAKYLAYQIR